MAVILVVEDDSFLLETLEWVLEDLGHLALSAGDLAGALVHLVAQRHIDVLFVDIRLKHLVFGGYDIANQAIALRPSLRVLYTSGSAHTEDMTARFVPGGRFVQKPYSPVQLETAFGELIH